MNINEIIASAIQGVKEIGAIIVTDDHLYYKEQKSLQLFSYFNI